MDADQSVAAFGRDVDVNRCTVPVFDDEHELDVVASTFEDETVKAVVSLPSDRDVRLFQGRDRVPTRRMTVQSSVDVLGDRQGRRDRVTIDGVLYEVIEVRDDTHPVLGSRKKTVFLEALPGR